MKETIQRQWPKQRISFKSKGKKWRKEHLDWGDKNSRIYNETVRKRIHDKKINVDFYNGIVHKEDMKLTINPNNMDNFYLPDAIQHYPIIAPRIDVLVGEEAARRFDWNVRVINPTSISLMEDNKRDMVRKEIDALIRTSDQMTEEEIKQRFERFSDYANFEWQDIREKRANVLLKHYARNLNVQHKFSEGFKDVLIHGEEGYYCDIIHGDPIFEKFNPLKTYIIRHGHSNRYQDGDVVIIDDYWSPGKVLDTWHDKLKTKDIDYINSGSNVSGHSRELDGDRFKEDLDDREGEYFKRSLMSIIDDSLDIADVTYESFSHRSNYFDSAGNVRVMRIFWRSQKKLLKIAWINPEDGAKEIKYRNESYVPNVMLGEEIIGTNWVSEWWQGTKVGQYVYVDMRPRPIQYTKLANPGYNVPGLVGRIYNTNDQKVVSVLDRAKVFNYIFNGAFYRLLEAYSKYFGPILEIDKAKFPKGWNVTKTLYFAKKAGVLVVDSFNEGRRGAATGKLAGTVANTTGQIYNSQIADYIRENIAVMEYAKQQMDEITGVPKQRLGNVEKRETVGGVDTAIRQANYVTEMLFRTHSEVKREALMLLLETTKIAMKGNRKKMSYIGDDYITKVMDIDGEQLSEDEHGLEIVNGVESDKLEQNLDMLAQAALQNQTLSFSTIMKIYTSPSLTEIQRLIEKDETQMQQRSAEERQEAIASQERMAAQETAFKQEELGIKEFDITERSRIEELKLLFDTDNNEVPDGDNDMDLAKLNLEVRKHVDAMKEKVADRTDKMEMHDDKMTMERKKLAKQATASVSK